MLSQPKWLYSCYTHCQSIVAATLWLAHRLTFSSTPCSNHSLTYHSLTFPAANAIPVHFTTRFSLACCISGAMSDTIGLGWLRNSLWGPSSFTHIHSLFQTRLTNTLDLRPMCVAKHCAHEHEWRCTYLTSPWWSQWMTPLLDSEELLAVWMALTPAGPSTPAVWVLPPPYSTYHLLCNYHKWTHYMRWIHKLVNRNIFIILVPYTWRKVSSVAYYYLNSKRLTVATVWSCLFRIFIATVCLVSRFRHVASLPKPPSPRKDSTR